MTGSTINKIESYLDEIIPNPQCELNYKKDYELLLATMLSAQTTDKKVNEVTDILFKKYKKLEELSNANIEDIKKIIKPIGTYNKKSQNIVEIATILKDLNYVPNDREYLEKLPGVGRKTTNVVLSNLYNIPCIAVDTHVERVSKRLGLTPKNADVKKVEEILTKKFKKEKLNRLHHQLVLFGRYYCKSKKPQCDKCKLKEICKYKTK
jgi:endonuclease-3